MNHNTARQFAEVTVMAGVLFSLPIGYYYGRPYILQGQQYFYNKMFKIDNT